MADVSVGRWDAFAQRIEICAVVCDALCSALLLQSALDGLEPLSLGLIKFRTWHLRIPKNMKSKSQQTAVEDVWGGPAVLLAPGQARPTRARIFPQRSRKNTNPIHRARPAGRPVGSACGFLSRADAGQVRLESAVRALPEAAVFASSIPYLDVSADSLAARGRRRRGHAAPLSQLMCPATAP